jgi:hypothetical protein
VHSFQSGDQFADATFPNFRALGFLDRVDVLLPKPERQAAEGSSGFGTIIKRIGQIGGFNDVPRRLVEFDIDLDDIAFANPSGGAMGGADADQPLPVQL